MRVLGFTAAAVFTLFLVKVVFIDRLREKVQFFPLIKNSDVLAVAPWIVSHLVSRSAHRDRCTTVSSRDRTRADRAPSGAGRQASPFIRLS